jgi:hypothetical protein
MEHHRLYSAEHHLLSSGMREELRRQQKWREPRLTRTQLFLLFLALLGSSCEAVAPTPPIRYEYHPVYDQSRKRP